MAAFHWEQEDAWFEACPHIWNSHLGWVFLPAPALCLKDVPWLLMIYMTLFCLNTILLKFQLLLRAVNFCNSCQWGIIFHWKLLSVSIWEKGESFVIGAVMFVKGGQSSSPPGDLSSFIPALWGHDVPEAAVIETWS